MKESYSEGLATHTGPESCVGGRKASGEALTGVRAGWVSSREMPSLLGANALGVAVRQHRPGRHRESRGDLARSKTPCTSGNIPRENREIPWLPSGGGCRPGRIGKSEDVIR